MFDFSNCKTINDILNISVKILSNISHTPRLDAELLLSYSLNIERYKLLTRLNDNIDQEYLYDFINLLKKRCDNYPVAYITNNKEFYSLNFYVNNNVLIPRPETEILVDMALYHTPSYGKLLDVGTGSGAIAISVKYNRNDIDAFACDISNDALKVAKINADNLLGKDTITFINSNLFENINNKFDCIVSNPPYIDPDDFDKLHPDIHKEPEEALLCNKNGFEITEKIIYESYNYLNEGGTLILEINEKHYDKFINHYSNFNFSIINDYSGLPRVAIGKKL